MLRIRHSSAFLSTFAIVALPEIVACAYGNDTYATVSRSVYPDHHKTMSLDYQDYRSLSDALNAYLGNKFHVRYVSCLEATVPLREQVEKFFVAPSRVAWSVGNNRFFTWSTMLHGGSCQVGIVFSRDMKVSLVATYRIGLIGVTAGKSSDSGYLNVLDVHVRNQNVLKYLGVLRRWADFETRDFSNADPMAPDTYRMRVYSLACKGVEGRIDVPLCRIDPTSPSGH